jgi:hypothetical protein
MASIQVIVNPQNAGADNTNIGIGGTAHLADSNMASWSVMIDADADPATWNQAIRDAAVNAINEAYGANTTGGEFDRVTIFGGAA